MQMKKKVFFFSNIVAHCVQFMLAPRAEKMLRRRNGKVVEQNNGDRKMVMRNKQIFLSPW